MGVNAYQELYNITGYAETENNIEPTPRLGEGIL